MLIVLEILAFVFTLLYLFFIAYQKPMGWLMGILASLISMVFFYIKGYYGSCLLNIIYVFQGVYGFVYWQSKTSINPRYFFKLWHHLMFVVLAFVLYFLLIKLSTVLIINDIKNFDIVLACFCILATYIETKKDISCWWYWIILNLVYGAYYFNAHFYLYALQMLVLAVFSVWALRRWLVAKASNV